MHFRDGKYRILNHCKNKFHQHDSTCQLLFGNVVKGIDVFNGSLFISLSCLLVVPVISGLNSREKDAVFELLTIVEDRPF